MSVRLRLKTLRDAHRMTQAEVAAHLGVGVSYYAAIERGERSTRQDKLEKLASLFSVRVADLYEETSLPPKLQNAVNLVLSKRGEGDMSDDLSDLLLVASGLDSPRLKALHQHALMLAQVERLPTG